MVKFVKNRMGLRVALLVNCFLIIMIAAGVGYLFQLQTGIMYKQMINEGRILSMIGAKGIAAVIEEAIDNNVLPMDAAFDKQYETISGFSPPKYHTKYDAYLDRAILKFQDEFLENPAVLYAVALDINGYVPTHNTRYQQSITGDAAKDTLGNRTKRIFTDEYSALAAKSQDKGFVQYYQKDEQNAVVDISSPVFVKGRHWGCFKVGMTPASIAMDKTAVLKSLLTGGAIFLIFTGIVVFLIVNRALKPLVRFSKMASDLADGDVDQKIVFKRKDEIGKVAEALERLRISLKAAIERLMRR